MKRKIIFRVDGNESIGMGHIVRSLSLAYILRENFNILFYLSQTPESIYTTISSNGFEFVLESDTHFFNGLSGTEIVVLDGYQFDTSYHFRIKEKGSTLICIDDLHNQHFLSDVVINHAPGVREKDYSAEKYTKFALGTKYALLRPAFLKQAQKENAVESLGGIFVNFGASDVKNATIPILQILLEYSSNYKIIAITGVSYPYLSSLRALVNSNPLRIDHRHNLNEEEMMKSMIESQLAIVPASGILFEVIACKTPCISGYLMPNQYNIYKGFLSKEVFYDAGQFKIPEVKRALHHALNDNAKQQLEKQKNCLDGLSAARYLKLFKQLGARFN